MCKRVLTFSMVVLLAGCSVGGGVGFGTGGVGLGAGMSFPIGQPSSDEPDCEGVVAQQMPLYPARAHALGLEGKVTVSFDVKLNGRAVNYKATNVSDKMFEREAFHAVQMSCWEPGQHQSFTYYWNINKGVQIK